MKQDERHYIIIKLPNGKELYYNNAKILVHNEVEIVFIDKFEEEHTFTSDVVKYLKRCSQ